MKPSREGAAAALLVFLSAAGCGCSPTRPAGRPSVITVRVDARGRGYAASFAAFFPRRITAHPGDTIRFESVFTGEPHTVTLGRMVDRALAAADAAGPGADPRTIPELEALPRFFKVGTQLVQPAAAPCFVAHGDPPAEGACRTRRTPRNAGDLAGQQPRRLGTVGESDDALGTA